MSSAPITSPPVYRVSFIRFKSSKGICLGGNTQLGVVHMGVDLRCIEVFVTEYLLQRTYINAAGEHQSCRSVTQLVSRVFFAVKARTKQ